MAGGASLYDDDDATPAITDINVTPFVDVVLVLLVVFMVTAKLIVARGIDVEKPKAATAGETHSQLRVSVTQDGQLFINGTKFDDDAKAIAQIKELTAAIAKPKVIIAGDRKGAYSGVMHAMDLVQQAGASVLLETERP